MEDTYRIGIWYMRNKIHIGYHKCGSTFLQQKIFPSVSNYEGRRYVKGRHAACNFRKFWKSTPLKSCRAIIEHYTCQKDIFISAEIFSKLTHKQLFETLDDKWDVLVVSRKLDDLLRSRILHPTTDFFLYKKIRSGVIEEWNYKF